MNHPQYPPQQGNGMVNNGPTSGNNIRQMPVRLSSVNFEGVFTSSRLNMESLINQNLYNNQRKPWSYELRSHAKWKINVILFFLLKNKLSIQLK